MVLFRVIEKILKIGPRKGEKSYCAVPKAPLKFSASWLTNRIVRETSLSEGDVRNVLISLRNVMIEVITLGGSLDLGDIFSFRVNIPSKMEAKEEDVSVHSLKKPHLVVSWKENVRTALKLIELGVDNPKRKKAKAKAVPKP